MYFIRTIDEGVTWKVYTNTETAGNIGEATLVDAGDLATVNAAYTDLVTATNFNSGAGSDDVLLECVIHMMFDYTDPFTALTVSKCIARIEFVDGGTDQISRAQHSVSLPIEESDVSGLTFADVALSTIEI